jgi:hypothetical protein
MEGRLTRRIAGVLHSRLPEVHLERVPDPRRKASIRWSLSSVLSLIVAAILAERKSLSQLENLSAEISPPARKLLKLPRRLPDTTVRDLLVKLEPDALRQALYRQVRAAVRRKALSPAGLPFGVVSLDGKFTAINDTKSRLVSVCGGEAKGKEYGKLGTVTATLISADAKPCLDARPIGAGWGEETVYPLALDELLEAYGALDLFKLVVYDAGACSMTNARSTRDADLHYMFRLKQGKQPKLHRAAHEALGSRTIEQADAVVEGRYQGNPERRSVYLSNNVTSWPQWTQMKTALCVRWELLDATGQTLKSDERYYVTSLDQVALTPKQWIEISRGHWDVENNCHHTFDAVFREDEKQWITSDANGMLAVLLLRRLAYNILSLFRTVTQRCAQGRHMPWRDLCRWFYNAMLLVTDEHLQGLRARKELCPGV